MPTIFESALADNLQSVTQLVNQGISIDSIFNGQGDGALVLANIAWYGKKTVGTSGFLFSAFCVACGIALGPLGAGMVLGALSATGGAAAMWAGDEALEKNTYQQMDWTPLHFAAAGNAKKVAKFLIMKNADVNLRDSSGRTFLQIAEALGRKDFFNYCEGLVQARNQLNAKADSAVANANQADEKTRIAEEKLDQARLAHQDSVRDNKKLMGEVITFKEERNGYAALSKDLLNKMTAAQKNCKAYRELYEKLLRKQGNNPHFFKQQSSAAGSARDDDEKERMKPISSQTTSSGVTIEDINDDPESDGGQYPFN